MSKERMDRMTTFVHHGSHIAHLPGSIHKNKRCAGLRKRAVVTTRCFAFPAVQIKPSHFFHLHQTFCEEGIDATETFNCFFDQFLAGSKRRQWFYAIWFSLCIP